MNNDFFAALSLLGAENSVETDLLVEKVKSAMTKPYTGRIRTAATTCGWILTR